MAQHTEMGPKVVKGIWYFRGWPEARSFAEGQVCIGFGDNRGVCREPRDPRSAYWCTTCEEARLDHIEARLQHLIDTWPKPEPRR